MKLKSKLYNGADISRSIKRMAHEILENTDSTDKLCLIGIKTRGVPLAKRLSDFIEKIEGVKVPVGILDVTLYRDDKKPSEAEVAAVTESLIDFDITGREVVLTDDVIYTGRTARAALEALIKYGRPQKIKLAAIVDRGHRELPIRPDFVGKNVPTSRNEIIKVSLEETDGKDEIDIYES